MIGQFLLVLRETLEATLIIAIVVAYLRRIGRDSFVRHVWHGVCLAVVAGLAFGTTIWSMYGGLTGPSKALFEGIAAFLAVSVLSSMIYWMATKGRRLRIEVERRVEAIVTRGSALALVFFSFIVVFREGLETVLFLTPFLLQSFVETLVGALLGVLVSLGLAYVIFVIGMKIDIRKLFYSTSILLILLAGGLAGYGVHELVEYAEETGIGLGWLGDQAYVLDMPEDNVLHHRGIVGSILAVMFGYTVEAERIRVIVHLAYLAIALPLTISVYRKEGA